MRATLARRCRSRGVLPALALAVVALANPSTVRAQAGMPALGVSADEVEADARMGELVLRGNVVVTYERFRLTSPRLSLRRTSRGIEVDGPGEVVFCPCASPPVSIAFAGGLVGPPADLVLRHPELRLGGVTMLGLPWFWLRAPTRAGVLPPTIAWRGSDGLLIGGGIHVPWRSADGFDEADFTAAGYLQGGVELTANVRTSRSTNRVRWDHLRADLLAIDARGVTSGQGGTTSFTWDIDAARGPRARSATLQLAEAALAYDHAAAESAVRLFDVMVLGVGVRALAPRGGYGPGVTSVWGPRLTAAAGGALFGLGTWDAALVGATFAGDADGPTHLARSHAGLTLAARPGWLAARLDVRESATLAAGPFASGLDAVASARGELSLPLARAYARPADDEDAAPFVHTIEPRADVGLLVARTRGAPFSDGARVFAPTTDGGGRTASASIGARTTFGRLLGHAGASVEGDVGALAPLHERALDPIPVTRLRAAWADRLWSLAIEGAQTLRAPRGHVWMSTTRIGEPQGFHAAVHLAGRRGVDPLVARTLMVASGTEPSGGFLAAEGWSGGAGVGARLGRGVTAKLAFDEDFASRTLLQVRGSLAYAHPCRCVAVDAYAGQRLGRDGVDVWVSIDLAPR